MESILKLMSMGEWRTQGLAKEEFKLKLCAIKLSQMITQEDIKLEWLFRVVSDLGKWSEALYYCIKALLGIGRLWEGGVTFSE